MHSASRAIRFFTVIVVLLTAPVFLIAGGRLSQLRSHDRVWAQIARASQWLGRGEICDGASSALIARGDLERWGHAVHLVLPYRARFEDENWRALIALQKDIDEGLNYGNEALVPFVLARCHQSAALARALLHEAVNAGLNSSTQPDRLEEIALRDLSAYGSVWLFSVLMLGMYLRRRLRLTEGAMRRLLLKVSEGDLDLPDGVKGLGDLPKLLAAGLRRVEDERELLRDKLGEGQRLIRRLLELIDAPVLVLSVQGVVEYVNLPAAKAFGRDPSGLQNRMLHTLLGGEQLQRVLESALECGRSRDQSELVTAEQGYAVRSALVHNAQGRPARVVMVLEPESATEFVRAADGALPPPQDVESEWWRRLWERVRTS